MVIYSGVNRYTIGQLGIMIWFHKAVSNKTEYYKFLNGIIEAKLKVHRGHLTILGVYVPKEGREELSEEFYETLWKILEK